MLLVLLQLPQRGYSNGNKQHFLGNSNRYMYQHRFLCNKKVVLMCTREACWPSGRASDSRARGRGFDPHSGRRVISLSKIHIPPKKVLVIPRKQWLRPDMTEKLLTGT